MAISAPVSPTPLLRVQQYLVLGVPCPAIESDMPMNSVSLCLSNDSWSQTARQCEVCREPCCGLPPACRDHYCARICQHGLPLGPCKPIQTVILSVYGSSASSVCNLKLWTLYRFCRAEKIEFLYFKYIYMFLKEDVK